jgi:hypothetical protein
MRRPVTFLLAAAFVIAAIPLAQAAAPRDPAPAVSVTEFSAAAKRPRNPYEGRATVYNPRGAGVYEEPWGPRSSPGTYGGGF